MACPRCGHSYGLCDPVNVLPTSNPCVCGCKMSGANVTNTPRTDGDAEIRIPDGVTPLVGYRGWNVGADGLLHSVNQGRIGESDWPPGEVSAARCNGREPKIDIILHEIPKSDFAAVEREIQAVIDRWSETWVDPHDPPNPDCACGLYAKLERDQLGDYGELHGQIEAWGKIVKGAYGFRAEHARIVGLYLEGARNAEVVHEVAQRYAVPILDLPASERAIPVSDILEVPKARSVREVLEDVDGRLEKGVRKLLGG